MLFTSATLRQMKTHTKSETSLCGSFQNTVVLAHCQCGLSRRRMTEKVRLAEV